jgi:signal transduction histidine kinase
VSTLKNEANLKRSGVFVCQQNDIDKFQALCHAGTWKIDFCMNTVTGSRETYRILNVPFGTSLGYEIFQEVTHPDDSMHVKREWNEMFEGKSFDTESRLLVNGQVKWVHQTAEVTFDNNGRAIGVDGIIRDITAQKILQEKVYRTAQLAYAGELASMVIHEVNNPLSGIMGYWRLIHPVMLSRSGNRMTI